MSEEKRLHYENILTEVAKQSSSRERLAEEAERETVKLKKVEYMADKVGEIYEGIISGVTGWGIYVELPNTIEGMVALNQLDDDFYEFDDKNMMVFGKRTKKTYRLGDRVLVYVAKVDRMMNTIDFMFEDDFETFED